MKYRLQKIIENNWDKICYGSKPKNIHFILYNNTFIVFKDKEKLPFVVIKFSLKNILEKEYTNLIKINKLLPEETPTPLFLEKVDGYSLLAQSVKTGISIQNLYLSGKLQKLIFKTLIKFHRSVYDGSFCLSQQHIDELFIKPINQFQKVNPTISMESEFNNLINKVDLFKNSFLPNIPQHCDFCSVNIIFNNLLEKIYIIDWADFGKTYLPLYDVFLFINSYYRYPEKFSGLLEDNKINLNFVKFINDYLKHFKIDKQYVSQLFPIFLIIFFNQNYSSNRLHTAENVKELIKFYLANKDKMFIRRFF